MSKFPALVMYQHMFAYLLYIQTVYCNGWYDNNFLNIFMLGECPTFPASTWRKRHSPSVRPAGAAQLESMENRLENILYSRIIL